MEEAAVLPMRPVTSSERNVKDRASLCARLVVLPLTTVGQTEPWLGARFPWVELSNSGCH